MCFHITQEYYFTWAVSFVTSCRIAKRINRSRCVYPAHRRAGIAAESDKIYDWNDTLALHVRCPSLPCTEHSRQRLMVFRKIIHVCRENHMKHVPALHGKTQKFDGQEITTWQHKLPCTSVEINIFSKCVHGLRLFYLMENQNNWASNAAEYVETCGEGEWELWLLIFLLQFNIFLIRVM